jgi:hypothetical protein
VLVEAAGTGPEVSAGPAAEPPVEAGDCGAAADEGDGPELSGVPVDDDVLVTEVEPAVDGEVVLWVVCVTMLDPPGVPGLVVGVDVVGDAVLMDWMTARLGFDPPPQLAGAVVATGWTVVLVVAAAGAVVGGVLAGTVVAGAAVVTGVGALLPDAAGADAAGVH